MHVPEVWSDYRISGTPIGKSGFATYRLTVKVKEAGLRLALQVLPISSAYRLY
jgi:hypothetical protein